MATLWVQDPGGKGGPVEEKAAGLRGWNQVAPRRRPPPQARCNLIGHLHLDLSQDEWLEAVRLFACRRMLASDSPLLAQVPTLEPFPPPPDPGPQGASPLAAFGASPKLEPHPLPARGRGGHKWGTPGLAGPPTVTPVLATESLGQDLPLCVCVCVCVCVGHASTALCMTTAGHSTTTVGRRDDSG